MQFSTLVDNVVEDKGRLNAINDLLARKMAGLELNQGPRDLVISGFLEEELNRMEQQGFKKHVQRCPVELLNDLFLDVVNPSFRKR